MCFLPAALLPHTLTSSPLSEEPAIGLVVFVQFVPITEAGQEGRERLSLVGWDFESREDAAEVGAVVPIVKQADVPAAAERIEKLQERAWPFWKLKPADPLGRDMRRPAAHHMANVQLRDLV